MFCKVYIVRCLDTAILKLLDSNAVICSQVALQQVVHLVLFENRSLTIINMLTVSFICASVLPTFERNQTIDIRGLCLEIVCLRMHLFKQVICVHTKVKMSFICWCHGTLQEIIACFSS